jgi:hypothetical protein
MTLSVHCCNMKKMLFYVAWVVGTFFATAVLAAIDARIALAVSGCLTILALYALVRPLARIQLGNRIGTGLFLISAIFAFLLSSGMLAQQTSKQAMVLRDADPKTYLMQIKGKVDDATYISELQKLDPQGHAQELRERTEAERKAAEIAAAKIDTERVELKNRLASASPLLLVDEIKLRQRYLELEPKDASNKTALEKARAQMLAIETQAAAEKERLETLRRARTDPASFLDMVDFTWKKGGFGAVMEASFKVKNKSPIGIKDIVFQCDHSGPSGTRMDSNTRTVFDFVNAGATKSFRNINMGFIHSQATSSSCRITSATGI